MRKGLSKNIEVAILEVDEHRYQTVDTKKINKQEFIKDVNGWLDLDKENTYSQVEIYEQVTEFLKGE